MKSDIMIDSAIGRVMLENKNDEKVKSSKKREREKKAIKMTHRKEVWIHYATQSAHC
jgi:hypothetical protein